MSRFYQVKVELVVNLETGKRKKFPYLVEAVSPTDAEARITQYLVDQEEKGFEVVDAVASKIVNVINVVTKKSK